MAPYARRLAYIHALFWVSSETRTWRTNKKGGRRRESNSNERTSGACIHCQLAEIVTFIILVEGGDSGDEIKTAEFPDAKNLPHQVCYRSVQWLNISCSRVLRMSHFVIFD